MQVRRSLARLVALLPALLVVGAGPADKVIPLPGLHGEAIVIPHDSPVRFSGFAEHDVARFNGRFVLVGRFSYGCEFCDQGDIRQDDLELKIEPDQALRRRLPRWKLRGGGDMAIYVSGSERLERTIGTAIERKALLDGKLPDLHGRIALVVDRYEAAIECDSPSYSAHFVSVAMRPKVARNEQYHDFGC